MTELLFMLTGKQEANVILVSLHPCLGAKVITSGGEKFYLVFLVMFIFFLHSVLHYMNAFI